MNAANYFFLIPRHFRAGEGLGIARRLAGLKLDRKAMSAANYFFLIPRHFRAGVIANCGGCFLGWRPERDSVNVPDYFPLIHTGLQICRNGQKTAKNGTFSGFQYLRIVVGGVGRYFRNRHISIWRVLIKEINLRLCSKSQEVADLRELFKIVFYI